MFLADKAQKLTNPKKQKVGMAFTPIKSKSYETFPICLNKTYMIFVIG